MPKTRLAQILLVFIIIFSIALATEATREVVPPEVHPTKFRVIYWDKEGHRVGQSQWTFNREEAERWQKEIPGPTGNATIDSQ